MKRFLLFFWKWISGFGLATTLLVLLGVLTWLATLEQVDHGLLATLDKYFHWSSWYILAEAPISVGDRNLVVPLPGGYWVCALLLVNMTLGGIIRARKGWKTLGVLISHFGIIFMITAGGVAQLFEERGVMFLFEGEQADFAVSLTEPTIEVFEIEDGAPLDEVTVVEPDQLRRLDPNDTRTVRLPDQPFDLELYGWHGNVAVRPGTGERSVDGWRIEPRELQTQGELNVPGAYARVVRENGDTGPPFILAVPPANSPVSEYAPQVIEAGDQRFAVRLVKRTIPVPYTVRLEDAVAEYFPNSTKPKSFMSEIERIEDEAVPVRIEMNEPMRRGGFTFFQRTMSGGPRMQEGPEFSGFEVVSNPADRWPEYGLYIVTAGLLIHFVMKFVGFLSGRTRTRAQAPS